MRRISLALALFGAVVAAGCGGAGNSGSDGSGGGKGIKEGTFKVTVQNGQDLNPLFPGADPLSIKGGYVVSTPAGIDCGEGATHTACSFDFPLNQVVTMTSYPDASTSKILLGWSGDCYGLVSSCTLQGNADKYIVVQFGTVADRTSHPNRTDPAVHGPEVAAGNFVCTQCHGATLEGAGLSVNCANCHDRAFLDACIQVNGRDISKKVEQCGACHGPTGPIPNGAAHALTGQVVVSAGPVAVAANGTDLEFTVNVKQGGANSDAFTTNSGGYRFFMDPALADTVSGGTGTQWWAGQVLPVIAKGNRVTLAAGTGISVAAPSNGNYLVTVPGGVAAVGANPTFLMIRLANATGQGATAVASYNGAPRDLVGDQGCINCHGPNVFREGLHHGANPQGAQACVICHTRNTSISRGAGGDRTTAYVHGIHNSHAMDPRMIGTTLKPGATYARNESTNPSSWFSVGFPSYMVNCSNCHDTDARLAAIAARPLNLSICISCHDSWAGLPTSPADHATYTTNTDCSGCHSGGVLDFHNEKLLMTERSGLVYDGKDQAVEQGARIALAITGVAYEDPANPTTLLVSWTAKLDGVAVNPCNSDFSSGNPVFFGATANAANGTSASNMSLLRAYAIGQDWVGSPAGTSPGQPISAPTLTASNTTCSGDVATSKLVAEAYPAGTTRAVVSLQGKPQIQFAATIGTAREIIQVRSPSPVLEFAPADASAVAPRRQIVSTAKCLACHQGSLYQHGGNRIDSVDLCVVCHNPASNDKNWRDSYGVTPATAYDGKAGETYDLRTLAHAVHSAGETNAPYVIYRGSNGIYAFGSQAAIDALPNWPGVGSFTVYPNTNATLRNHSEIVVHYPRPVNDCGACHVDGFNSFPSGTQAVAVTTSAGAFVASPADGSDVGYANQLDDVLMGGITAACMSCHQSGDPAVQAAFRSHAYEYGWTPSIFPNGRQTLVDDATP